MLRWIKLAGVGPADKMDVQLAPRINVITGDNGLGKTFLLDVAWWTLTRTWVGTPAIPTRNKKVATIRYVVRGKAKDAPIVSSSFRFDTQTWPVDESRPPASGIVIYARVDGGFSVWDPARNYRKDDGPERPKAYNFDRSQIWEGLDVDGKRVCEGLERDWVSWQQRAKAPEFAWLKRALLALSAPDEPIEPGEPRRVFVGEGRDRPTIRMNGQEVPIVLASAGVRRVLAIAYLLVWAWREHQLERALQHLREPERRLVFLFDEPETHLHPRWQRAILPAILRAADELRSEGAETQLVTATHSPLVLASLEPTFDAEKDQLFRLQLQGERVTIETGGWAKQGDALNWLVSEVFGLHQARSLQAERAIDAANAFMRDEKSALPEGLETKHAIDAELRRLLPGHDPFWPRWLVSTKQVGRKQA